MTIDSNSRPEKMDYTFELDATGNASPDAGASSVTTLEAPPKMLITVNPNPLVETGTGNVEAVVEVSTASWLAGAEVDISSYQLDASCKGGVTFTSISSGVTAPTTGNPIGITLDADGNAVVAVNGRQCAAGNRLFEAALAAAPYYSAVSTLDVLASQNAQPGITGYPGDEVITGTTTGSGESDVYAVFYVGAPSVYAEQYVQIQASGLVDRCGAGSFWVSNEGTSTTTGTVAGSSQTWLAQLDDNGNAVFAFFGASCASGTSTVLADFEAGRHQGYMTLFEILSPRNIIP